MPTPRPLAVRLQSRGIVDRKNLPAYSAGGFSVIVPGQGEGGPKLLVRRLAFGDQECAYAQAETFNGIDGRLEKIGIPVIGDILKRYPFRVWTTFGWQWQPRLARGDQLGNALRRDAALRRWYADIGVTPGSTATWSNLEHIALH